MARVGATQLAHGSPPCRPDHSRVERCCGGPTVPWRSWYYFTRKKILQGRFQRNLTDSHSLVKYWRKHALQMQTIRNQSMAFLTVLHPFLLTFFSYRTLWPWSKMNFSVNLPPPLKWWHDPWSVITPVATVIVPHRGVIKCCILHLQCQKEEETSQEAFFEGKKQIER